MLAGLVHCRINAGEAYNGAAAGEAAHIPNLCYQLRGSPLTHAVQGPDSIVFGKLSGQAIHLSPQNGQRSLGRGQFLGGGGDQQLGIAVSGQGGDIAHAVHVQLRRFPLAEMVALSLAPFAVAFSKSHLTGQIDALTVPKGHDKIHPLLAAIGTVRTGEQFVHTRKYLVSKRDEVVLQRHHVFHVQIVLP